MKLTILLTLLVVGAWGAQAQTNRVELKQPGSRAGMPSVSVQPAQPTRLQRIFGPTATTGGVVPEIQKRLTNRNGQATATRPPAREYQNVSVNPHTGAADGIALFAIRF